MRHGEAEDGGPGAFDRRRRLVEAGVKQARETARLLAEGGWIPAKAFVSDAVRTRETWEAAQPLLGAQVAVEYRSDLYRGSWEALLGTVAKAEGASTPCQMVLGHNPAVSDLVVDLTGAYAGLSPAAAAVMTIDAESWAEAAAALGGWHLATVISN
jgi:phosphohistidine phosphatase